MAKGASPKNSGRRNQARASRSGKPGRPAASWRTAQGRRLLVIENAHFRVELWPEKGGAITAYVHRPSGLDVIWRNSYGQPPRLHVSGQPRAGGSDLFDVMDGSWFVSLPNGFFPGDYFGAPLGTHGEMRCVPWTVESVRAQGGILRIIMTGTSLRTPLTYRRELTVRAASGQLSWRETVGNRSAKPLPIAWLHHPAFGGPLIEGARLVAPARTVSVNPDEQSRLATAQGRLQGRWPRVPERKGGGRRRDCGAVPSAGSGADHSVHLSDFSAGMGCIWNEKLKLGFAMQWDLAMFPCAWSWAHAGGGVPRYPMWGEGHLITLQPSTSPPGRFPDLLQRKQLRIVPAKGSVTTEMRTGFVAQPDGPWAD